jgi:hypothetical protein
MSAFEVKRETENLPAKERRELAAFLVIHRLV